MAAYVTQPMGQQGPALKNQPRRLVMRQLFDNERYKELARRQSYYDCTQHDLKRFDFDGRIIPTGVAAGSNYPGFNAAGEKFGAYVPLKMRRPSSPYRLSRAIVSSFTNLLFGEDRFPSLRTEGDPTSQDFNQALVKAGSLPSKMIRARNIGGAVGTTALSWAFIDGKPRINVHNAKNLFVHEWEDREQLIPAAVSETYLFNRDEFDSSKNRIVRNVYIYRRDWDVDEEIVFKPVLYKSGVEPFWEPKRWETHNDGTAHVVWIQNVPSDEIDGLPDYHGLYENFDDLDLILSIITRGATLNLDPTLKLKMDIEQVIRMGVRKGSDQALAVGIGGDAEYLELEGSSIKAGVDLLAVKRSYALECCDCVVIDPDSVAAGGLSSVAQKAMYHRMLGKTGIMREQYGTGIEQLIEQMSTIARVRWGSPMDTGEDDAPEPANDTHTIDGDDNDGKDGKKKGVWSLSLPPIVKKKQPTKDDGSIDPEAEPEVTTKEHEPGTGGTIVVKWPPYFMPTPDDRSKEAATLNLATGMKPFISAETATEHMAQMYGVEPEEEKRRVAGETAQADAKQAQMFADQNGAMGGKPGAGAPPGGGEEDESTPPPVKKPPPFADIGKKPPP